MVAVDDPQGVIRPPRQCQRRDGERVPLLTQLPQTMRRQWPRIAGAVWRRIVDIQDGDVDTLEAVGGQPDRAAIDQVLGFDFVAFRRQLVSYACHWAEIPPVQVILLWGHVTSVAFSVPRL